MASWNTILEGVLEKRRALERPSLQAAFDSFEEAKQIYDSKWKEGRTSAIGDLKKIERNILSDEDTYKREQEFTLHESFVGNTLMVIGFIGCPFMGEKLLNLLALGACVSIISKIYDVIYMQKKLINTSSNFKKAKHILDQHALDTRRLNTLLQTFKTNVSKLHINSENTADVKYYLNDVGLPANYDVEEAVKILVNGPKVNENLSTTLSELPITVDEGVLLIRTLVQFIPMVITKTKLSNDELHEQSRMMGRGIAKLDSELTECHLIFR